MGHTQDTRHKGGVGTHQCVKRVGITRWQDGICVNKFSKLFTKIAMAKAATIKAKEQWNNLCTHSNALQAVPLPRVVDRPPIPASPLPRVPIALAEADCRIRDVGERLQMVGMASQVAVQPTQIVES